MFNYVNKQTIAAVLCLTALSACNKLMTADEYLAEARRYQLNGDNRSAIIQLKNAIQRNPDSVEPRYFLGTVYNEMGDAASAEKELRKAISLGMDQAHVLPDIGKALMAQGKYHRVLEEMTAASDSDASANAAISVLRANAYLALDKPQESRDIFDRLLKQQPDNPAALIGMAKHALRTAKDNDSAVGYAKQATEKNPENIDAWLFQGDLLRSQGQLKPALHAYDRVLQIKPENISAHISKAYLYIQEKEFDAARFNIEAARKSDPAHIIVYYAQALLDFNMGNYGSSREALQQVLRVAPRHMPSLLLAGAVQFALGSMPQAEQHLKQYLEVNPENSYARKLLATTLLKRGDANQSLAILHPALNDSPQDAQLLAIAGECFMHNKDFEKAAEYFEQASLLTPDAAHLHTSLSISKLAVGDYSRAISELERAVGLDSNSPQAGLILAMTQLRFKQYEQALNTLQGMEKLHIDNPLLQNLKGSIYRAQQDTVNARASFQRALALQPGYFPAAENLAQLDMQENKPDLARKHFMGILEHDKKNVQAMLALARLAQSQGNDREATSWLEKASRENPASLAASMQLAIHYLRSGMKTQALSFIKNNQILNPESSDLLQLLAQAQLANDMQPAALDTLHKLSVMMPESAAIQLHIANVHLSLNNFPAASEALKKSLSLQPDYIDALMAQASLAMKQANFPGALQIARGIQKKNKNSPLAYVMEADVLMAQKKPGTAIAQYEHALALGQNWSIGQALPLAQNGAVLRKLHRALRQAGRSQEADARITQWLKDNPADHASRMYLANGYLAEKRNREAIAQFQILLQQNPDNSALLNNLAWAYHQEKDALALSYAEKAYQNSADSPAVLDTMGWILAEQGDIKRGLPLLQKAATMAPEASDIRFHLAQGLVRAGDKSGARKELEFLLEKDKSFSGYDAAKSLLGQLQ